jgi:hypothetical protein
MTQIQESFKSSPSDKHLILSITDGMTKVADAQIVDFAYGYMIISQKMLPKLIKQLIRARVAHVLGFKNVVY